MNEVLMNDALKLPELGGPELPIPPLVVPEQYKIPVLLMNEQFIIFISILLEARSKYCLVPTLFSKVQLTISTIGRIT